MITKKTQANLIFITLLLILLPINAQAHKNATHQKPNIAIHLQTPQQRISAFIYSVQPNKGKNYANTVAGYIVKDGKKNHISPYMIATTGYVESEFNMTSRGGLGIMQISPSTYRSAGYKRKGLKAMRLADNIQIGSSELARHYNLTSRGGFDRMEYTWKRYNGSGSGGYVRKSVNTYRAILNGNPEVWKNHLRKHGPLWR